MDMLSSIISNPVFAAAGALGGNATNTGANGGGSSFNLQTLFNKIQFTGNIMIDSYIMMNAITIMKGWAEIAFSFLTHFLYVFFAWIVQYVTSFVKSKFTGKVIFRSRVEEGSSLYKMLFNAIFDSNIEGDVHEDWKFRWLKVESDFVHEDSSFFDSWKKKDYYYSTPVDLDIDYMSSNHHKLQFKQNYGMSDKKVVIFKYVTSKEYKDDFLKVPRTFYIKITWVQHEHKNYAHDSSETQNVKKRHITFDMILFDHIHNTISKTVIFDVFYDFLTTRFKSFIDNMVFSYKFLYPSSNSTLMYSYFYITACSSGVYFRNVSEGWLIYGDDDMSEISRIIDSASHVNYEQSRDLNKLPNCSHIKMIAKPVNQEYELEKNISIVTRNGTNTNLHGNNVDIAGKLMYIAGHNDNGGNRGFFQFNKMAVVISMDGLILLKRGDYVTRDDVFKVMKHIVDYNVSYNSKQLDTQKVNQKKQQTIYKWSSDDNGWTSAVLSKRSFDTIYLPKKLKGDIIREFDNFVRMEKLYRKVEVPYRKGMLFYGPPGTGKTSLVKAIAYEYQIPLYILDVNAEGINDDSIVNILNSLGGNGIKILLFEDIDTAFASKEKMASEDKTVMTTHVEIDPELEAYYKNIGYPSSHSKLDKYEKTPAQKPETKDASQIPNSHPPTIADNSRSAQITKTVVEPQRKFLTYSGLLNAFDGVMSNQTGVITILTTNYIEKLGDAFIRPGRVDARFKLMECDKEQIEEMVRSFIDKSKEVFEQTKDECLGSDNILNKLDKDKLGEYISEFAAKLCGDNGLSVLKPCQIQSYLLKYISNPVDIFEHYEELMIK